MGIVGLEKFIDILFKNKMKNEPLNEIKFVVDGNQLPYLICRDIYGNNEFSGNYDIIYNHFKSILTALKPYIVIIIFDGLFFYTTN